MAVQPEKKKGCLRNPLVIIGVGGLVLICALMAYGGGQIGPTATEEATPVPMPLPTETVGPTSAPLPTPPPRGYVSKATFAGDWPLTVEEGFMDCLRPQQVFFLSLDRQRVWAVNAPARSQIEEKGWSDVEEIQIEGSDLFGLIDLGLDLCP